MGFYGNITNPATTNLIFDKTYGSKYALMNSIKADNIYLSRYALVEYDYDDSKEGVYDTFYSDGSENLYTTSDKNQMVIVTTEEDPLYPNKAANGQVNGLVKRYQIVKGITNKGIAYFQCILGNEGSVAKFKEISPADASTYARNQAIDNIIYNEAKGFDSTAWQKIYDNNTDTESYLNIANLNSVVPTFEVSSDAPTSLPDQPHFSAISGGVYYNLHVQPQWGLRVAKAKDTTKSDGKTKWTKHVFLEDGTIQEHFYNANQNSWILSNTASEEEQVNIPAAIYYNAAGFDEKVRTEDTTTNNYIKILPTGESGNEYNTHNGASTKTAKDIQEMEISLPSIGNAICKVWDIVHGPNRDDSALNSLQGKLNSFNTLDNNSIPLVKNQTFVSGKLQGDSWINTNISDTNINIQHSGPSDTQAIIGGTTSGIEKTLNYGETIVVPKIGYDSKGHISSGSTYAYVLPSISLASNNEGNIITNITLNSSTGAFVKTLGNVGDLVLTNYSLGESSENIVNTDTINSAISKLQNQIKNNVNGNETTNNLITQEVENRNKAIESAIQIEATERSKQDQALDVKITNLDNRITTEVSTINNTITSNISTLNDTINSKESNLKSEFNSSISGVNDSIASLNTTLSTADTTNLTNAKEYTNNEIAKLNYTETETDDGTKYVYSVTENKGIITVNKKTFPAFYNANTKFTYGTEEKTTAELSNIIYELSVKVSALEQELITANNTITDLTTRIESLEGTTTPTE